MRRYFSIIPAGLVLGTFATAAAAQSPREAKILSDAEISPVRAVRSSPVRLEEAPLFKIDPRQPAAAMIADIERRAIVAEVPRKLREARPRR
jgi:hypothetical protein